MADETPQPADLDQADEGSDAPASPKHPAWWLATRRRRSEWQSLTAAGLATFSGRPRAHFEAAQPGDPVLIYVSKPDHAIRAVGVVVQAGSHNGNGFGTGNSNSEVVPVVLEVQLAFELPNPIAWRDILAVPALAGAEPVRQRSSGTLFGLTQGEYRALQALMIVRNPELAAAFTAIDMGAIAAHENGPELSTSAEDVTTAIPQRLREELATYAPAMPYSSLPPVRSLADLQALTSLPAETLEEARDLLEDTGQIILSGPPGTGKTWLARGLAALAGGDPSRVQVVQFHPSTAYEDFIEGLKPRLDASGHVSYAVVPGIFVRLCEEARRDPDSHYVLLIDEINRAPLSRVFGELLYALEYRGPQGAVELSVSAGMGRPSTPFYVPENLLIIGTMNSADRSIALVDYALRRRFRFVELEPNSAILDGWLAAHGAARNCRRIVLDLFEAINARLAETLDRDHRLGHSYFMLDPLTPSSLDRLWRTALRPLVTEYFVTPTGEVEEYAALFAEAAAELSREGC
jgi:hypothetical protein